MLVAGVTWTSVTTSAPWAARWYHTSVVDAAGAIYVLGGLSLKVKGGTASYLQDVWASADGGADRTRAGGTRGYWVGTTGVLQWYRGVLKW